MYRLIAHILNPLHVYCRLRDLKIPKHHALRIGRLYERYFFVPVMAPRHRNVARGESIGQGERTVAGNIRRKGP